MSEHTCDKLFIQLNLAWKKILYKNLTAKS